MKTTISTLNVLLLYVLIFSVVPALAQAQWLLPGNNLVGGEKLGSLNNFPLNIVTNNTSRIFITQAGRVGIGTVSPANILTIQSSGSIPSVKWITGGAPLFTGFGETTSGNSDFILSMASNAFNARPVVISRRSRGTLAAPTVIAANDYLGSFLASGYDGSGFQNTAAVDFFADGAASVGNVPARISFSTGTNSSNRQERLKVGSTGNFDFNAGQLTLQQSTGSIGIGISSPVAQLDIRNTTNINSVYVTNSSTNTTQFGVRSFVNGAAPGSSRTAGEFLATGSGNNNTGISSSASTSVVNYGGTFTATGGNSTNIGTWGFASGPGGSNNYGVYGSIGSSSSGSDWAGYFRGRTYSSNRMVLGLNENPENAQLTVRTPDTSYNAVFASTANPGGNGILSTYVGSPTVYYAFWGIAPVTNQNVAGYFSGNVIYTGTLSQPSDERLKQDVKPLSSALDKVMKIGVHSYSFKPEYSSMNLSQGKQYGYLAQNLAGIFPELVQNTADKTKDLKKPFLYKTVNYIGMVPILTKALQEEHEQRLKTEEQVNMLKADNEILKKRLEDIELAISRLSLSQQTYTGAEAIAKLDQNSPNPFNRKSIITCTIPSSAKTAIIVVYAIDGKAVKTFNNLSKGVNRIEMGANIFAAGTYTYVLRVDGKQIESRQMVITR